MNLLIQQKFPSSRKFLSFFYLFFILFLSFFYPFSILAKILTLSNFEAKTHYYFRKKDNFKDKKRIKRIIFLKSWEVPKIQTALWLACKYDAIYLRATNLMTGRWLLEEVAKEMDEIPRYLTSDNFNLIVQKLKQKQQLIIVDEIDYLMNNLKTIEILRDIHDETDCPIIFVGMGLAHKKLERYKHLYDRFSEIVKFETFS